MKGDVSNFNCKSWDTSYALDSKNSTEKVLLKISSIAEIVSIKIGVWG